MKNLVKNTILLILIFGCSCIDRKPESVENLNKKVLVEVNPTVELGIVRRSELYNNNSLLRVPRKEVTDKYLERLGKTKIMRCWITLNDCWDYKTGEINYDFPVGWGFNLWGTYYDYIDRFSLISEEILLNIRGNHELVVNGEISMEEWKDVCKSVIVHFKKRCPNIKYIEALNEYTGKHFGGLTHEQYYNFYKVFYEIVNEVNNELKPEIPLLVGGPCIMGGSLDSDAPTSKQTKMLAFLDNYARDNSEFKRLDFISYHQYNDTKENPSTVKSHENLIDSWLRERNLPDDLPIFINEMGCFPGSSKNGCVDEDLFVTACNIASLFYYYNQQPDMQGFHWVIQHKTNERKNQMLDDLRWTPYGISLVMQGMHKEKKIEVKSNGIENGLGVYAEASSNDSSVVLHLWNYQWLNNKSIDIDIVFNELERKFNNSTIIKNLYLLDYKNNNFLNSDSYYWKSDPKNDMIITESDTLKPSQQIKTNLTLNPNTMALYELKILN